MDFVRAVYYFFHAIILNVLHPRIHIALSARVKPHVTIGDYVKIGKRSWIYGRIGDYSYIGSDCRLNASIGKFCSISPDVKTVDATHPLDFISTAPVFFSTGKQCGKTFCDKSYYNELLYKDPKCKISVFIGNDVWIGEGVKIKGGVSIGDGAVIAMGSIVTKDVEPYAVVAGVPAKLIRKRFNDDVIENLLAIRWWDYHEAWLLKNIDCFRSTEIETVIKQLRREQNSDEG